jgi:hypothetical protein
VPLWFLRVCFQSHRFVRSGVQSELQGKWSHLNTLPAIRFVHHFLQNDDSGNKLSKTKGAHSLKMMKSKHKKPTWIYQETAKSLNLPFQEIRTFDDLKETFQSAMVLKDGQIKLLDRMN